jgi:hypothetical protein
VGAGLREPLACGLATGAMGGLALILFRVAKGVAQTDPQRFERFYLVIWIGALSAGAAAAVLAVLRPRRGAGAALLAGPVACTVAVAVFVAENTLGGGELTYTFVKSLLLPPLALGLMATTCVAPLALLARPRVRPAVVWRAGVAVAAAASALLVVQRDGVFPPDSLESDALAAVNGSRAALVGTIDAPETYVRVVGRNLLTRYAAIGSVLQRTSGAASEAQIRAGIETPARRLLAEERAIPVAGRVAPVHATCVRAIAALAAEADALASVAGAREAGDATRLQAALARALTATTESARQGNACVAAMRRLLA